MINVIVVDERSDTKVVLSLPAVPVRGDGILLANDKWYEVIRRDFYEGTRGVDGRDSFVVVVREL